MGSHRTKMRGSRGRRTRGNPDGGTGGRGDRATARRRRAWTRRRGEEREPGFRGEGGYRRRMAPAALAKRRELPGAKGKTDRELGEEFFRGQSARLVASMAGDVETPAEVRVVVDPYSRQAFLAVGR